jgi:RNA polymerase sigma-70 factor (ECF subfamily)
MVGTLTIESLSMWPAWADKGEVALVEPSGDEALARAAARGNHNAFSKLVETYQRSVYGLCYRLLRDAEEANDAAQEAFVRAYSAIESYDPRQPFAPWVLRIARNHCLDLLRRRVPAERLVPLDAPPQEGQSRRELVDERAAQGDTAMEQMERSIALDAAVAQLPDRYREVISLFHVQQLSYQQIATVMNVPIGTVMTWLHRARAQLRNQLITKEEVAS